ncbi:MAG: sigma-E processing peptidase SpoIIGA [Clostridia bacterium]
MKTYLDYIFFENIIINMLIFIQVDIVIKCKSKKSNKILGTIILSVYTTICTIIYESFFTNMLVKIFIVNVCIYIIYKPKTTIIYLKQIVFYFLVNFLYIGIILGITLLFDVKIDNFYKRITMYILSYFILRLFNTNLWKMWKTSIKKSSLTYTLNIRGQEIVGFVDTGNTAKSLEYGLDILFVDSSYYAKIINSSDITKKININLNTVNCKSQTNGYILKNIEVYKDSKNIAKIPKIIVCFSSDTMPSLEYDALINFNTYFECLRGVTIC